MLYKKDSSHNFIFWEQRYKKLSYEANLLITHFTFNAKSIYSNLLEIKVLYIILHFLH